MKDPHPSGRWEQRQERWPPGRADGGWEQTWAQLPYSSDPAGLSPSFPGWQNFVPQRPRSIEIAFALMCVGGGLDGLGFILGLLNAGLGRGGGYVGSAVGTVLWSWMALANRAGRKPARIIATVFFGIDTLALLMLFLVFHVLLHLAARVGTSVSSIMGTTGSALLVGGVWLLGLTTVLLLWRKESSDYYAAMGAFR
jgi:hypothetical protein